MRKLCVLLATIFVCLLAFAQQQAAVNAVNSEHIRAHVKFLSSDLLEGRGTGQRGGSLASAYIATQFELYGLKPAGENGSFLQKVPMLGIATDPQTKISLVPAQGAPLNLALATDIVAMDESQQPASDLDADIVFVGYGISAPEYQWDDYKGVDLRGKVLLMLVNEPPSDDPKFFNGKALTYYGRWTYKFEEAARRGAVGALIIHKTEMASYPWQVVETSWGGERSYLRGESAPKLHLASWIQYGVANKLAALIGADIEKLITQAASRDFKPITVPARVKAHVVSKVRPFESENVVALLPGSDAKLKDQAVLYSAHFDHLGIHPEQPGDNIYNGAVDNATGCGILLEMARAFASAPQRPRRSLLFAAVTAEEQGLLGSHYLGQHPPIPADRIDLALNFDALAPIGIPEAVTVTGSDRTTFYPTVQQTAAEFKFEIAPDANPGAGSYYRSDHFSLARVGIPAFSVNQGPKFAGRPREWSDAFRKEFTAKHYHQPSDEYRPDWDFAGNARMAQFGIVLGWKAANTTTPVAWKPGDEFAKPRSAAAR